MNLPLPFAARLVLTGASLAALLLAAPLPASAHRIEKHFIVEGQPVVNVRSSHGRIEIRSWKKPEVVVIGTHTSNKVEVDTEQAGNRIEIVTRVLDEYLLPADMRADYTITVPEETQLQINTDAGLVIVERVFGDMTFGTVDGGVQLQEVSGYLSFNTVSGPVTCRQCAGRLNLTSISGEVKLLQSQLENVRVTTTSGNIYFDGEFLRTGIYILKNYSGVIDVRFSDTDSFDLNAVSRYGRVENQAALKPDPHGQRIPRSRYSAGIGTFNGGHAKVELSSFNGTIKIRKRD